MDISNALAWYGITQALIGRDYTYTPPVGGFISNNETEYNAITWTDAEEKPAWTSLSPSNIQILIDIFGKTRYAGNNFVSLQTAISALSVSRSFTNPTRPLNTAFQISTTRDAVVSYSVDIACTLSILGGQLGTVVLEYADNAGITTNVVTVSDGVNGNTGALTIGLNLTQTFTLALSGLVPAGKYVRLRTANTTGTPTFTYRRAQEVLV